MDTLETTYTARYEKGTEAEMCPAIVSGIVTGHAPVSYWSIFVLSLITVPEVFAIVNSVQSPFRWAVYWILILLKVQFKIMIKNKFTLLQNI